MVFEEFQRINLGLAPRRIEFSKWSDNFGITELDTIVLCQVSRKRLMIPEYCISIILNRMTHVRVDDALFIWDFGTRPNSAGARKLKLLNLTSLFWKTTVFPSKLELEI